MQERLDQGASVSTSGRLFDQWIDRSRADLALLTTSLPTGPYPYAGIPWFATQFGRDAIITALQTLWLNPRLAAGVLRFLASTQATEDSAFRDSQPGKIMHETRRGEMAALQEVPFGRYYGGVDTTPLFVMLAGAYENRTGDRALVDSIWDCACSRRPAGSSGGSLRVRPDFWTMRAAKRPAWSTRRGRTATTRCSTTTAAFRNGPLAVVEVQGYAYAALKCMAELATRRGDEAARHAVAAQSRRAAHRDRRALLGPADATSTPSRSTATARRAACTHRTPGICSTAACRATSARRWWRHS